MTAAIRHTVTVQPGGVVHFSSPKLREGTEANVIVLVTVCPEPARRLAAFHALQQSLALTPAVAEKWTREVVAERTTYEWACAYFAPHDGEAVTLACSYPSYVMAMLRLRVTTGRHALSSHVWKRTIKSRGSGPARGTLNRITINAFPS